MNSLCRYILPILLLLLNLTAESISGRNPDKFNDEVRRIFDNLDMTGLGIAVVDGDSIIYQESFGYKELPENGKGGIRLANDDLFRIASISKTFIATVILQLQEEGKLSLDDDAQEYLKFPLRNPSIKDRPITIRHLLTHTSGINDARSWWNVDHINPDVDAEYYKCYSSTAPGRQYKYCNMNYTVLGAIIEGVTDHKFFEEVDRRIMKPLDIGGGFNCNDLDSSRFVRLYRYKPELHKYKEDDEAYRPYKGIIDRNYKLGREFGLAYPASGMRISTGDLAKYMMMHMNGGTIGGVRIISAESEEAMRRNYVGKNNYGLSFRHYNDLYPGKSLSGQTGGGHGLRSAMIFDPEDNVGFVIICSGSRSEYIDGYGDIHKPIIKLAYQYLLDYPEQN